MDKTKRDEIIGLVGDVCGAIKASYPGTWFSDTEDIRNFKNMLYTKIKNNNCSTSAIVDGVDLAIERSPKFPPTLPQICAAIIQEQKKIEKAGVQAAEVKSIENKSVTENNCDPVTMLADAKRESDKTQCHQEKVNAHDELIKDHLRRGLVSQVMHQAEKSCSVGFCTNPGSISNSVNGSEQWFCIEHFRH